MTSTIMAKNGQFLKIIILYYLAFPWTIVTGFTIAFLHYLSNKLNILQCVVKNELSKAKARHAQKHWKIEQFILDMNHALVQYNSSSFVQW